MTGYFVVDGYIYYLDSDDSFIDVYTSQKCLIVHFYIIYCMLIYHNKAVNKVTI